MTDKVKWQDLELKGTAKALELKKKFKSARCQHTFTNKNLERELDSLEDIAEGIKASGGPTVGRTPTPRERSIMNNMKTFQAKGDELMDKINNDIIDLIGTLTDIGTNVKLNADQAEAITQDIEDQMQKQEDRSVRND